MCLDVCVPVYDCVVVTTCPCVPMLYTGPGRNYPFMSLWSGLYVFTCDYV